MDEKTIAENRKKLEEIDWGIIQPKDKSDLQQVILDLANGVREPENDEERELLEEIKEAEAMGYMMDLPFD